MKQSLVKFVSSSLFRSSGIYTLGNLINAGLPFLLIPVLTRYLSPSDYGMVAMFQVLTNFLYPFVGLNANNGIIVVFFKQDVYRYSEYIGNALVILLVSAFSCLGLIYLLGEKIESLTAFPFQWQWLVVLFCCFQFINQILLQYWINSKESTRYTLFQFIQTIINLLLSLSLLMVFKMNWEGRVFGQLLAFGVSAVFALWFLSKKNYLTFKYNPGYIKHALKVGLPLIPHFIGGMAIFMADRVFLTKMVGLSATGIYALGYQFGQIIGILADSFNKAYIPWLFEKLKSGGKREKLSIVQSTYIYFVLILIAAMVLTLASSFIFKVFVGPEFAGATKYILFVSIGFAFNGMYKMVTNYFFFIEKTSYLAWITLAVGGLNIGLSYTFIYFNGAIGAAQASCLSFFIFFISTWVVSNFVYKMPWGMGFLRFKNQLLKK